MKFKKFVVAVCDHLLDSSKTSTPTKTPSKSTASASSTGSRTTSSSTVLYRVRVCRPRTLKKLKGPMNPYEGPGGEVNKPLKQALCVGGDLVKGTHKRKDGSGLKRGRCVYCSSAFAKRRNVKTSWFCELCGVPLCVSCNFKYHRWVNDE